MADFAASTLYRAWFFPNDPASLDAQFSAKTEAYLDCIVRFIDFDKLPAKGETAREKVRSLALTQDQETKILIVYIDELRSQYRNLLQWSEDERRFQNAHVVAVAMTYFQRFFLKRSVFEYEAPKIAFACLFLAAKVQEMSLTHETFCKTFK